MTALYNAITYKIICNYIVYLVLTYITKIYSFNIETLYTYSIKSDNEAHLCFLSFASASVTCLVTIAILPIPSISTSELAGDDELVFS